MARAEKTAAVAEIVESFNGSQGAVLTDYRGLTVAELQRLRRTLGENASFAVVKNTLTKIAAAEAGVEEVDDLLEGPTAIAFIHGDAVEVAKSLRDFSKEHEALSIKGGILDGSFLDAQEVATLANLESREVLLGRLAGGMKATMTRTAQVLDAPASQFARLAGALQAKREEAPGEEPTGAAEASAGADEAAAADEETAADEG